MVGVPTTGINGPSPVVVQSDEESVHLLSSSFTALFGAPLKQIRAKLDELQRSQAALINTVHNENIRFENIPELENIHNVFAKVILYQSKLVQLKKDILNINERVAKLKKRSTALQQKKINSELSQAEKIDKVLQKEKELMAKPAKSLLSPTGPVAMAIPAATTNTTPTQPAPTEHRERDREKIKSTPKILPPARR